MLLTGDSDYPGYKIIIGVRLLKICFLKRTDRQFCDWFALFWGVLFTLFCLPVAAASVQPKIVLIIDDIGHRYSDHRALKLPREVTFSILPDAPLTTEMSELAHAQGRDIMLHMPMESFDGQDMGVDGLRVGMYENQMEVLFDKVHMREFTYIGVNNHMGSRLTSMFNPMRAFMDILKNRDLFFVDSRTSVKTVAEEAALHAGIPVARRHVFLDHVIQHEAIEREFDRMLLLAREQGVAVAIGHPHKVTMEILQRRLPELREMGIELATVSSLFEPAEPTMMAQQTAETSTEATLVAPN